jgi:hypothetical protein
MKRDLLRAMAVVGALALDSPVLAQTTLERAPAHVSIPRVDVAPKLDDFADGNPAGVEVSGFKQRDPGDLTPVSEPTTAYLS